MDGAKAKPIELSDEEQRIYERLEDVFEEERRRMAQALCGAGSQLFGRAEYELRDQVHRLGARALEAAADERQKKGMATRELAWSARAAGRMRGSSRGGASGV